MSTNGREQGGGPAEPARGRGLEEQGGPRPVQAGGDELLGTLEAHPHARAVLAAALPPAGQPSHAYLFHGPAGTGKRDAARAFAAALLADGAADPAEVTGRAMRGAHPDLTWVTPSGASELLVGDVEEPVVAAATRTPFEAARRVFVIEAAGTMNDQAANRMLKTLEEPPSFAHLILLAGHPQDVLPTIASRCQQVRFDPLAGEQVAQRLIAARGDDVDVERARACARLSAGDGDLAERLASDDGAALRTCAESFVRSAVHGLSGERRWMDLLAIAREAGEQAAAHAGERLRRQAELLPARERRKHEREGAEAVRRAERRARAGTLDLGLRLAELWLRDAWCLAIGAGELVLAVDRRAELQEDLEGRDAATFQRALESVGDTRLRLPLNVSEELALEALSYGIEDLRG